MREVIRKNAITFFVAFTLIAIAAAVITAVPASAQQIGDGNIKYEPLVGIPGFPTQGTSGFDIAAYFNAAFRIAVVVAAMLAVVMIVVGGFEYMTSEAIGGKKEGRDRITAALGGLILLLFAYILLGTINPEILNLGFTVQAVRNQGNQTVNFGGGGSGATSASLMNRIENLNTKNCNTPVINSAGKNVGNFICAEPGNILTLKKEANQTPQDIDSYWDAFAKNCQNTFQGSPSYCVKTSSSDCSNVGSATQGPGNYEYYQMSCATDY